MKLWQKIFLSSLALLVLATGGLSLLFLNSTRPSCGSGKSSGPPCSSSL